MKISVERDSDVIKIIGDGECMHEVIATPVSYIGQPGVSEFIKSMQSFAASEASKIQNLSSSEIATVSRLLASSLLKGHI